VETADIDQVKVQSAG